MGLLASPAASSCASAGAICGVRCAHVTPCPCPGELQVLEAVVQDAGDRPGAVHRGDGDPLDDLADVAPGQLVACC